VRAKDVNRRFKDRPVIVLDGYLVDVGAFSQEHPGGDGLLKAGYGGRDLSTGFRTLNYHSDYAKGLVEDMRVAKVEYGRNRRHRK
jgi:cytochrome b involved in lipid metabolism